MKKISRILFLFITVSLFAVVNSRAQEIALKFRLNRPATVDVTHRPPRPSDRHVWVAEEWVPNGHSYDYRQAHWEERPTPNAIWVPGHWAQHPNGWVWKRGHWDTDR